MFICQNCGEEWALEALDPVQDMHERLEPGDLVPEGQCPDCGAFCLEQVVTWADLGPDLLAALRGVMPLAVDGVEARDRDGASSADEGQRQIEAARAAIARAGATS